MSDSRVTITLGRSGQKVIKRAGPVSDGFGSDSVSLSGNKRSIRDRLGSNVGSSFPSIKRQREDDLKPSSVIRRLNDAQVGRNDLRLKLMQRRLSRQERSDAEHHRRIELRERLAGTDLPPARANMASHMSGMREPPLHRPIHRTGSADEFLFRQPPRESNSSWAMNGSRHHSPGRIPSSSRGFSTPKYVDGLRSVPSVRSMDASRSGRYARSDIINPSRPVGPTPMTMKDPLEHAKSIAPPTATGGGVPKSSYTAQRPVTSGEAPLTVAGLLNSLGLGKYAILFQAEEVDMAALKQMGDQDLKELGIPMGPRKKILLALLPRNKRQPP